jgi:hypothetical protein
MQETAPPPRTIYWRPMRLAALFSLFSLFALTTGDFLYLASLLFLLFLVPWPTTRRKLP